MCVKSFKNNFETKFFVRSKFFKSLKLLLNIIVYKIRKESCIRNKLIQKSIKIISWIPNSLYLNTIHDKFIV